ncbi:UNVERIFIED_ORG: hypothetical protein GGE64_004225 [Rhizobium etli]
MMPGQGLKIWILFYINQMMPSDRRHAFGITLQPATV